MLDIELMDKLLKEFSENINHPEFIEFLIQENLENVIDNFFAEVSVALLNYKNKDPNDG